MQAELKATKQEADELTALKNERDQLKQELLTAREKERQKVERLQEGRTEETERDELKRHAAYLEAEKKFVEREAELRAEMEALKTENNQLKTESDQFQQKISEQNESLINVNANLQQITVYSRNQQLKIRRLQDEISAAKQRSAETQLRQLNELQSPTKETTELKETLTELKHQQLPATEEHHQGNYCLTWAYVSTMSKTKT